MPIASRLKLFLDEYQVRYVSMVHSRAYSAQDVAASLHVKGKILAKTVMVKLGRNDLMAVLPATHRIDFDLLARATQQIDVRLATEPEFQKLFPECEPGAMPPFGNLWGIKVLCEKELSDDEEIVFNAGTHTQVIRMAFQDFERLVSPKIARFSVHI